MDPKQYTFDPPSRRSVRANETMAKQNLPKEGGDWRDASDRSDFFRDLYAGNLKRKAENGQVIIKNNDDSSQPQSALPLLSDSNALVATVPEQGWVAKNEKRYRYAKLHLPDRGKWTGRFDFLMSMIAYAVGLGNVWRFPYLCYENGGGAFFVPYFLCWILAATPIFFMEVALGQFLGQGGISVWKICPIFKGIGWANQGIASMCNIYYCVIVAWALFYVLASFSGTLPWTLCDRWWNNQTLCFNKTLARDNNTVADYLKYLASFNLTFNDTQTPVEQFWENRVLKTTHTIDEMGTVQWELCGILVCVWLFTYFALWKGITRARKMIYVCAIAPYILIFILLIRGITLKGAIKGIGYYLYPRIGQLRNAKVWKDAGTQIFYSFGIGFGTLIALGSYNNYNHNVYRDAIIMCVINSSTSILAGFVVFSVLGYMSDVTGKEVDEVVKSGVGLAFLVYPEAIITMPVAQVWSVLFFLMIMILGLDSQVCTVEGVITAMCDQFPLLLRNKKFFVAILCIVHCLLGLPLVTQSGQYWLKLIDNFGASGITLLFVMFFEVIALSWCFGADKIYLALEDMIGYRPRRIWYYFWKITAPLTAVLIFVFIFAMYEPLKYPNGSSYPSWAQAVGLLMSLTSMLMIPGYAIYYLIVTPGKSLMEKLRKGFTPSEDVKEKLELIYEKRRLQELNAVEPPRADCDKTCSRMSLAPHTLTQVHSNLNDNLHTDENEYDPRYSPHITHKR